MLRLAIGWRGMRPSTTSFTRPIFLRPNSSVALLDDLLRRGCIQNVTKEDSLRDALTSKQVIYAGIDPTADALHVGHLMPMMCLLHFHIHGHRILPLIGGATGLVGDPSGRMTERMPADPKKIQANVISLTERVEKFFQGALRYASSRANLSAVNEISPEIISNLVWHQDVRLLEFLKDIGVHVRINTMLNRESVQSRMDSQQGISFTEFTYQLLQAYDFYHLFKHHDCSIQIGGSDQWGNILAGIELIGRLEESSEQRRKPFGITTPLLTTASGEKFGKSAGNAIWLDRQMTSVFDFYQFFMKTADQDVERYLNLFTLLPSEKIAQIMKGAHKNHPEKRIAQKLLADEVTEMVHGQSGVAHAQLITKLLFESQYSDLQASLVLAALKDDPRLVLMKEADMFSIPLVKLIATFGLLPSTAASRILVQSKGLYLNNERVLDVHFRLNKSDLIDGRFVIIRAGKEKHLIIGTDH